MDIDEKGKVIGSQIAETVICVDQRMTYTSVKKILEDQDAEEIEKYQEFVPMFEKMRELSELLRKNRHARGSIDFDFPEAKIILDQKKENRLISDHTRQIQRQRLSKILCCLQMRQ